MLRTTVSVTGHWPNSGSVQAGGQSAGEGGIGRGGEGGGAGAGGGGGEGDGDPEGVVVPTVGSASLGLLQDVLGVVHGDQAGQSVCFCVWKRIIISYYCLTGS